MDLYTAVAYENSRTLTLRYSTSFSSSSRLFSKALRPHIFAIYGLVRIADEIVDTYKATDADEYLEHLQQEVNRALDTGFSTNPIVHAFITTARRYTIDRSLIQPFFESMRMDLHPHTYTDTLYTRYIHGSAEVIGLMCLKVFVADPVRYQKLAPGAMKLGAAYQKINFLRDMAADYTLLGRTYFPGVQYETVSAADKQAITKDIRSDLAAALPALRALPSSSRRATALSLAYYSTLLTQLEKASIATIKQSRLRVSHLHKVLLLIKVIGTGGNI